MRVLGVDLGRRRIGIALGETEAGVASPRSVLVASGSLDKDAQAICALASAEQAELVVVGLPLGYENSLIERGARLLAERLAALGLRVEMVDESLTTAQADRDMADAGATVALRRKRIDSEAACRILERYFIQHG